ncbi:glycosyltransferase [Alcaligenaceae bacterium]|nr:glycosyltransferase [Alcaligenaceae bacterium]
MKLLFTDIHQHNGGGHVTYILGLLDALRHHHQVTLAAPISSRLYRYASQLEGVTVVPGAYTSRILTLAAEVARLHRYLAQQQFDLVHVNASADHRHVMLARLGLRKPPKIVWTKHNLHPLTSVGHQLRARFGTDSVIAVSDFVHKVLLDSPYRKLPIHTIRHGIDLDRFQVASSIEKQRQRQRFLGPLADDILVFGSTGGTDFDKGWLDLVAAVATLSPPDRQRIRLLVAGDPPNDTRRQILASHGLTEQVIFPGLVDDVRDVLAACDVGFVLSHHEALSYACRESLASGLPTLISNAGGLPENLEDGVEGWIVPVRDTQAIAEVLKRVLAQPQILPSMGHAARLHSERFFSMQDFVQSTLKVYQGTLACES